MIAIIHLSDLHITERQLIDDEFIDSINNAVEYELDKEDILYYICSGDIAYSGKDDEYKVAKNFFDRLLKRNSGSKLLIVPGNHDNNFESDNSVRASVIKDLFTTKTVTNAQIEECLKVQKNFNNFEQNINANEGCISTLLNKEIFLDCKNKSISFTLINSAYCCNKDSNEGQIFVPNNFIANKNTGTDYNIAVLHHTSNWFMSPCQREVRSALNSFDLIITGHEHESSSFILENNDKKRTNFVEGGVFNFTNRQYSFNLIKIDLDNDLIRIIEFVYDNTKKLFRINNDNQQKINDNKYITNYTSLTDDIRNFLEDTGASFKHPHKEILKLSDIYIPPNVQSLEREDDEYIKSSLSLIDEEIGKYIISGGDKYGKTSLAKYIYSELILCGYIPIYIDCRSYSKNKIFNIDKLILSNYKEQYKNYDVDEFKQNAKNKAVPIIDNFHLSKLENIDRVRLLKKLNDRYKNVYIFIGNYFIIDEFKRIDELNYSNNCLQHFNCFKIKSFGYKLRGKLIKKWLCITDDQLNTDTSYLNQYDNFMTIFDKIVSNNLVPPLPIYFLTALSAFNHFDPSIGSYGEYYRALTTLSLATTDKNPAELDIKINFLSELAFKFFIENESSINESNFNKFINYYNKKYAIDLKYNILDSFIESRILVESNTVIYFKYKFILYYFIANYIHRNLYEDDKIDTALDKLIKTIYLQSSSAILLIILSFVKDNRIINKISEFAKSIFAEALPANIGDDTRHFNQLVENALQIVVEDKLPINSRNENEELQDSISVNDDKFTTNKDSISEFDDDEMDKFSSNISSTIHCINIIGQILKSHYGTLRTDQKELLFTEGLNLPLRTLGDFYHYTESNTSMWLEEIKDILKKRDIKDSITIEKIARKYLLFLSSCISYVFISMPVHAFSTPNLQKTYEEYFSKSEDTNANALIDFYLNLRTYKTIDFQKLENLVKRFSNNVMGFTILQQIISYHLYMYNICSADKSRIASLLNISIEKQLLKSLKYNNIEK